MTQPRDPLKPVPQFDPDTKFEIRKLFQRRGHDSMILDLEVWINNIKVCRVTNDGNGGSNHYEMFDMGLYTRLLTHTRSLPPVSWAGHMSVPMDLDLFIGDLIEKHQEQKQFIRWCKDSIVFRLKGDQPGKWRSIHKTNDDLTTTLRTQYGTKLEEVLNERPEIKAATAKFKPRAPKNDPVRLKLMRALKRYMKLDSDSRAGHHIVPRQWAECHQAAREALAEAGCQMMDEAGR